MNFFIIVPSVMAISIFLIHHFADYIGINIKYQSLFLCAIISFLVDILAIFLSDFLNFDYYLHMGILIIAGALLANYYNSWLLHRDEVKNIVSSVDEAAARREAESIQMLDQEKQKLVSQAIKSINFDESNDESNDRSNVEKKIETNPRAELENRLDVFETSIGTSIKNSIENPVEQKLDSKLEAKLENKIDSQLDSTLENPVESKIKSIPPFKMTKPVHVPISDDNKTEEKEDDLEILEDHQNRSSNLPNFDNLDDLIDYARDKEDSREYFKAILAYRTALEKFRDDEAAPFIAIELGNIYREQAEYSKAIQIYEEAMDLPIVKNDLEVSLEFSRNLLYLRTVQLVLLQHHALQTPYSKIPQEYMAEIEKTFAEKIAK